MFKLISSSDVGVILRCQYCENLQSFSKECFEDIQPNMVIFKQNYKVITCHACRKTHHINSRTIKRELPTPSFSQTVHTPKPSNKSKLPFWMTREATTEEIMRTIIADE